MLARVGCAKMDCGDHGVVGDGFGFDDICHYPAKLLPVAFFAGRRGSRIFSRHDSLPEEMVSFSSAGSRRGVVYDWLRTAGRRDGRSDFGRAAGSALPATWRDGSGCSCIEGLPAVLLGGVVLAYLTDRPEVAPWLTTEERAWLTGELAREQSAHPEASRSHVFAAFTQGKVWLLVLVYLGDTTCTYGVGLWLPSLIRSVSGSAISSSDCSRPSLIS